MSAKIDMSISNSKKSSMVTIHKIASPAISIKLMVPIILFCLKFWKCILLHKEEGIYHRKEDEKILQSRQGGCPLVEYYNELNSIFMELHY
ncbi:hypothetical protein AAG906_006514 [Vitis piasezkii]